MNKQKNNFDEDKDKRKSNKSVSRKKKRGQRHHVRGILRELTTTSEDQYYDYIDEIEEK